VSRAPGAVLGDGREAVVYALDEHRVLKVFRDLADADERASREFAIGVMLHEQGLPVARPIELTRWEGAPALVSQRVHGASLNAELSRAPWKVVKVARQLAAAQAALHSIQPPASLDHLHDVVERRLRSNADVPSELVDAALRALAGLPRGDRLCHGNAHLGNIILRGGEPVLVDCGDATIGDPAAEVAHTLVRYRCARLRGGAPLLARLSSAIGRRLLGVCYLHAYSSLVDLDHAEVDRWVGVRAVERLAEGHPHERRRLARLARGRLAAGSAERAADQASAAT